MALTRFRMVSLLAAVGPLIGTIIMRASRFFPRHAAGALVVAVAVVGALLIGGVANAVPPAGTPVVTVSTAAPTATTTTLMTSPVSPVAQGTPVKLTAAVIPETAIGNVQFKDGADNLGKPVMVTDGTASGNISTLAVGSRQLTAVFTPTDLAAFSPSTSPAVPFMVTAPAAPAGATATNTTLTTDPASSVTEGTPVKLTATVTPATAIGAIQFKDGTTDIGKPVPVTGGTASTTASMLAVGSRQLTAMFTPTDPAAFSPSTSPTVSLTVTTTTGSTTPETQQSGQSLDGLVTIDLGGRDQSSASRDGRALSVLDGLVVVDLDGRDQSAPVRDSQANNDLDGLVVVDLGGVLDLDGNDRGRTSTVRDNDDGLLGGLVSVVLGDR